MLDSTIIVNSVEKRFDQKKINRQKYFNQYFRSELNKLNQPIYFSHWVYYDNQIVSYLVKHSY